MIMMSRSRTFRVLKDTLMIFLTETTKKNVSAHYLALLSLSAHYLAFLSLPASNSHETVHFTDMGSNSKFSSGAENSNARKGYEKHVVPATFDHAKFPSACYVNLSLANVIKVRNDPFFFLSLYFYCYDMAPTAIVVLRYRYLSYN